VTDLVLAEIVLESAIDPRLDFDLIGQLDPADRDKADRELNGRATDLRLDIVRIGQTDQVGRDKADREPNGDPAIRDPAIARLSAAVVGAIEIAPTSAISTSATTTFWSIDPDGITAGTIPGGVGEEAVGPAIGTITVLIIITVGTTAAGTVAIGEATGISRWRGAPWVGGLAR
jgi:hypothetical protein